MHVDGTIADSSFIACDRGGHVHDESSRTGSQLNEIRIRDRHYFRSVLASVTVWERYRLWHDAANALSTLYRKEKTAVCLGDSYGCYVLLRLQ